METQFYTFRIGEQPNSTQKLDGDKDKIEAKVETKQQIVFRPTVF